MKAQAYYHGEKIVRIFDRRGVMIADLPLSETTDEAADSTLEKMKLKRRGPWSEGVGWGREASVRFVR